MTHPFQDCSLFKSAFDLPARIPASREALAAVRAVKNRNNWSHYSSLMYAIKMNVPPLMFFVANEFEDRRNKNTSKDFC